MKLYEALNIELDKKEIISFVGAGGKTTSLFKLAKELKEAGSSVLITTTTAIYSPAKESYDRLILTDEDDHKKRLQVKNTQSICVLGKAISRENKLLGLEPSKILDISNQNIFNYILIEADGAKRKPIKAPAPHEPVIPSNTTKLIGVIGLDALNKEIGEAWVHRPQFFCQLTEGKIGGKIDINRVVKLVAADDGLYKNCPDSCQKYLLFNKTDNPTRENLIIKISNYLKQNQISLKGVIAASMKEKENYIKWSDGF